MSDQEKISEYFEIGEARYFRKWFAHYLNYLSHDEALMLFKRWQQFTNY